MKKQKINTISLRKLAKAVSSDPKLFEEDFLHIHVKLYAFRAKYGVFPLQILLQTLEKEMV